jgi:membrane protein implicated in regulation of membrane protease activity
MLVGMAGHDLAVDLHADAALDADHGDPSEAFKVLSIQSIAAFLMGFGWGGAAAYLGSGLGPLRSTIVGLAVGAGMMWVLSKFLRSMHRLQTSGNITIDEAVGCEGAVYLSIPARGAGRGQLRVTVEGRDRIYNAVSDTDELPTGARARVVRANPDNTVTVSRI